MTWFDMHAGARTAEASEHSCFLEPILHGSMQLLSQYDPARRRRAYEDLRLTAPTPRAGSVQVPSCTLYTIVRIRSIATACGPTTRRLQLPLELAAWTS